VQYLQVVKKPNALVTLGAGGGGWGGVLVTLLGLDFYGGDCEGGNLLWPCRFRGPPTGEGGS